MNTTFCFITICQLYGKKSDVSTRWYLKMLTILTMIAYTSCTIGDVIHMIIRFGNYLASNEWHLSESYLAGINDAVYYFGNFIFFVLLFMRIKTSFQLTKAIMYYLSMLLIMSIMCSIIYCFIIFYFVGKPGVTLNNYLLITSYPLSITDLLLNMSLFFLFICKIKNKDTMEGIEIADNISTQSSNSNGPVSISNNRVIWNVMIKHCVLFGIAMISNQLWYVTTIIDALEISNTNFSSVLIRDYTARSVENTINIVILWLVLTVNNDKYVRLCNCWHRFVLKYCMKEDPSIIREGFVVDDNARMLVINQEPAIVNNEDNHVRHCDVIGIKHYKVEGRNLLLTKGRNDQ